jgi:hypothetical protein
MSPSLAPTKDEDLAAVTFVKYRIKSESEQIMVWLLQTIARFCLPDVAAQPGESDLISSAIYRVRARDARIRVTPHQPP